MSKNLVCVRVANGETGGALCSLSPFGSEGGVEGGGKRSLGERTVGVFIMLE